MWGGSEATSSSIVCPDVDGVEAALQLAERIADAVNGTFSLDGSSVDIHASTGVAFQDTPVAVESLLTAADRAMYDAKRHHTGVVLASPDHGSPRS